MDNTSIMNIVFSANQRYFTQMVVSIYSICRNTSKKYKKVFHIFYNNIVSENLNDLQSMVHEFGNEIEIYDFQKIKVRREILSPEFSPADYRICISSVISQSINRALYFDSDTVILKDFDDFYFTDMSNILICGVEDIMTKSEKVAIGMRAEDIYLNSGVLLFNLELWRKEKIEDKCFDYFISNGKSKFTYPDQEVLNHVCLGKVKVVKPKFNAITPFFEYNRNQILKLSNAKIDYYKQEELDEAIQNPVVIHYAGSEYCRPWFIECRHPRKADYVNLLYEINIVSKEIKHAEIPMQKRFVRFLHEKLPFCIWTWTKKSIIYLRLKIK